MNRYGLIVFENLDIRAMQEEGNRVINQGIGDVSWAKFVHYTTYKAERAGRVVVRVNPKDTTQMCSNPECKKLVPKDLSVRVHDCPHCGLVLDRDLNAAKNILRRGMASVGVQATPV